MDFSHQLKFAIKVAKKAGDYVLSQHEGDFAIDEKLANYDFVTAVDKKSEDIIRQEMKKEYPEYPFIGEEDDTTEEEMLDFLDNMSDQQVCWVVDPIDGTLNFMQGIPGYGVSIALVKGGKPVIGVIYLPHTGEMFYAEKGKGAWLEDKRLSVSKVDTLNQSVINASVPMIDIEFRSVISGQLSQLIPKVRAVRALGSAIQAMAYIAAGRMEAYWAVDLKPWDVSAGIVLLEEAGGCVVNFNGEKYKYGERFVLSTNTHINDAFIPYTTLK